MNLLQLAPTLALPVSTVTDPIAILGVRGSGKTTTARLLVEQLTKANQQSVILDPTGAWWGLRSHFDISILGGDHGDVPLDVTTGVTVADLVVENPWSVVLDMSHMRKAEMRRFALPFIETLYHRNREALMLVVDECDLFIPQRVQSGMEPLVGAMEDIVRRGRKRGIGVTLISQRPASVHKDVLSQVQMLFAHQLTGAHDRKAVKEWIDANASEEGVEMLASLSKAKPGSAWVWAPAQGIFKQVQVNKPLSFDSGSTPKPGEKQKSPELRRIDVDVLEAKFAEVIEEERSNDPKELRAVIRKLEQTLTEKTRMFDQWVERGDQVKVEIAADLDRRVDIAHTEGFQAGYRSGYGTAFNYVGNELKPFLTWLDEQKDEIERDPRMLAVQAEQVSRPDIPLVNPAPTAAGPGIASGLSLYPTPADGMRASRKAPPHPQPLEYGLGATDPTMTGPQRKLLSVLATYGSMNIQRLAIQTGYSNSGGFRNIISSLRKVGWLEGTSSSLDITNEGFNALGPYDPLPKGQDLVQHWVDELPGPHGKVLVVIIGAGMGGITLDNLAEATGYRNSGGFRNIVSKLRTLGLVTKGQPVRITDEFFEAIA